MRLPRNNGSALEKTVIASQLGVIRIEQFKAGQRFMSKAERLRKFRTLDGSPTTAGQVVPCDFIGTVVGTGRSIWFDAKSCGEPASFNAAASHVKSHQRLALCNQGECGAVAGLLVEATALRGFYWLPWWLLGTNETCYAWGRLIPIGLSNRAIDFRGLIAVHDEATPDRFRVKGGQHAA
jgi:hypothetical protein